MVGSDSDNVRDVPHTNSSFPPRRRSPAAHIRPAAPPPNLPIPDTPRPSYSISNSPSPNLAAVATHSNSRSLLVDDLSNPPPQSIFSSPLSSNHHLSVPDPDHPSESKSEHQAPSSRKALTRALELAREAVQLDSTNDNPELAVAAYAKSLALFSEVMERVRRGEDTTESPSKRRNGQRRSVAAQEAELRRLQNIHDTYADRMNILSIVYNIPPPPIPASLYSTSSTSTSTVKVPITLTSPLPPVASSERPVSLYSTSTIMTSTSTVGVPITLTPSERPVSLYSTSSTTMTSTSMVGVPITLTSPLPPMASSDPLRKEPQRLINTSTLRLEEFSEHVTVPTYAILSHRWVHGEEISLKEFLGNRKRTKRKSGYVKIFNACKRAREDGLSYIWVDTCCIDKGNHDDIARNIKSMYAYYKRSHICYAYLADVTSSYINPSGKGIGESEWFDRGWTLQELLAPQRVVFLNRSWVELGDRNKFSSIISSTTGIPVEVLDGRTPLHDVPAPNRFIWSVHRQTTKPEDQAYCLVGILDVSMEPCYGEGVESAFNRLQQVLIHSHSQASKGWEIFNGVGGLYSMIVAWNLENRNRLKSKFVVDEVDPDWDSKWATYSSSSGSESEPGDLDPEDYDSDWD